MATQTTTNRLHLEAKGYRRMTSRYDGFCRTCKAKFAAGTEIMFLARDAAVRAGFNGAVTVHFDLCSKPAPAAPAIRVCECRCDGWCEQCAPFNCFANNHGRKAI